MDASIWMLLAGQLAPMAPHHGDLTLKPGTLQAIVDASRDYYEAQAADKLRDAEKILGKVESEVARASSSLRLEDPLGCLSLVDDMRRIATLSFVTAKPDSRLRGFDTFKLIDTPLSAKLNLGSRRASDLKPKDLQNAFDLKRKVWISIPKAPAGSPPVIVALHPTADETQKSLREMKKSTDLVKEVEAWAKATYPPEVLSQAIVVAPVLDVVTLAADGVTASRPAWDSFLGKYFAYTSLSDLVLANLDHDDARVFLDGHGNSAAAAMFYCAQHPGLQAGAIVRGSTPQKVVFANCRGAPLLFVGAEAKDFYTTWVSQEGFDLTHVDTLDAAELMQWIGAHHKEFSPLRVELTTTRFESRGAYWVQISDISLTLERAPDARIVGEIDREKNQITVTTNERVKGFHLYLNDALVDLGRKVRVIHRREATPREEGAKPEVSETVAYEDLVPRSLRRMLELNYSRVHGNGGEYYVAQISIQ